MAETRKIRSIVTGKNAVDGAGVKLVRVIGHANTTDFDPFLMLDAFDATDPQDYIKGFPWHPHRGIETITYLVRGEIEHGDSLGNKGSILDGHCQWMTAGSGIVHQEMPKPADRMLGVQLWLNLPAKDKMVSPKYRDISNDDIPEVTEDGSRIRIIAGEYKGQQGAIEGDYVKALYLDVDLSPDASWKMEIQKEDTLFIYILQGEASFGEDFDTLVSEKHAILFTEGDCFTVKASARGIRFLMMAGKPLHEPIAWGGPIVMNTRQELALAFDELENGTFIK